MKLRSFTTQENRAQIVQNWWKFDLSWDHNVFYYKQASFVWSNHSSLISTGSISPGIYDILQLLGNLKSFSHSFPRWFYPSILLSWHSSQRTVVSSGAPKRRRSRTCWGKSKVGHEDVQGAGAGLLWGELRMLSLRKRFLCDLNAGILPEGGIQGSKRGNFHRGTEIQDKGEWVKTEIG